MKALRVTLAVLALLALPFVASAQGRGQAKPRPQYEVGECKPEHRAAIERARAEGREIPAGLDKKCQDAPPAPPPPPPPPPAPPPPPPSPEPPPSGIHRVAGVVYEDIDGDGHQNMFGAEMGLEGWTVQLYWNGGIVASATSDANGFFSFPGLGNSTWIVCVIPQAGYNRTQPVSGPSLCGGAGYEHVLNSPFQTVGESNFGMMLQ